jgi:hypothetical protein
MPNTPEFSSDEEERIRQKQEEFQNVIEEHKKRHPSGGLSLGIDPGNDPIVREAMTRLMEKNIEQALATYAGQALDPDALHRMRAEAREQINALFARNSS